MLQICQDLRAEQQDLDELVAGLGDDRADIATPAEGWSVKDQIGHLAFFDGTALLAATDPEAFAAEVAAAMENPERIIDGHLDTARAMPFGALLEMWRSGRERLLDALLRLDPATRLPWYGPPMSARSFATARLMETWAHGQDVADALGVRRTPTARLKHIAHLGVRTRPWSYLVRGEPVPDGEVRVELTAPDGRLWRWHEQADVDVIEGPAEDFCLVVTQRRHPADTRLRVRGPLAEEWMGIAQAFAGPPGPGRPAGSFVHGDDENWTPAHRP